MAGRSGAARGAAARAVRGDLAKRYLAGEGLEIGALHRPLPLHPAARARYVDRMSAPELRRHYPELEGFDLVDVDIVDDGETLATVADASVDFVVANHFVEHTQSPLAALATFLRVLRPGGVLYLAVPDKRRTFDVEREVTPLEHVVRDLHEGPEWSRAQHFEEWARHVEHVPAGRVAGRAATLMQEDYSIHFHVWAPPDFAAMLEHARTVEGMPFVIEETAEVGQEFIVVLRRAA